MAETIGNKVLWAALIFGIKITDNQMPPLGETHFFSMDRPLPLVWRSAITIVPCKSPLSSFSLSLAFNNNCFSILEIAKV